MSSGQDIWDYLVSIPYNKLGIRYGLAEMLTATVIFMVPFGLACLTACHLCD